MIKPFSGMAILCRFVRYRVYNQEREDRFLVPFKRALIIIVDFIQCSLYRGQTLMKH